MATAVHACGLEYSSGKIASVERRGGVNIQKRSFTSAEAPTVQQLRQLGHVSRDRLVERDSKCVFQSL